MLTHYLLTVVVEVDKEEEEEEVDDIEDDDVAFISETMDSAVAIDSIESNVENNKNRKITMVVCLSKKVLFFQKHK